MIRQNSLLNCGAWKPQESNPAIEANDPAPRGEPVTVVARTAPEILDHFNVMPHIRRFSLYFCPEETEYPLFQAQTELETVCVLYYDKETDTVSARQEITVRFKPAASGTVYTSNYSNFFGSKRNTKRIDLR